MEKTSEEMYDSVSEIVSMCMEMYKSQPVTNDMVKNFNEIADKLNDMDWESTDEAVDDEINELVKYFVEFADSLKEAQEKANYIEED